MYSRFENKYEKFIDHHIAFIIIIFVTVIIIIIIVIKFHFSFENALSQILLFKKLF